MIHWTYPASVKVGERDIGYCGFAVAIGGAKRLAVPRQKRRRECWQEYSCAREGEGEREREVSVGRRERIHVDRTVVQSCHHVRIETSVSWHRGIGRSQIKPCYIRATGSSVQSDIATGIRGSVRAKLEVVQ